MDEGKPANKRKYFTIEPSYYNCIMRQVIAYRCKKAQAKQTFLL